jgi:carbonyl reductase 1
VSWRWPGYSHTQTPEQAARAVLDLVLAGRLDPATYGELVQFGQVLPWHSGTPWHSQDQMLSR